jgi:hypothetical protein
VPGDEIFALPQQGMGPMVGLYWFRGCKGPQPSKVNVISQGGMASVPSPFLIFQESMSKAILSSVFYLLYIIFCR